MSTIATIHVTVVTTPWCHHCRAMQPTLQRLAAQYGDWMRIDQIDAAAEPDVARRFGVQATPTVIVHVDGVERGRLIGRVPDHDLEAFVASAGAHRPFPRDGLLRGAAGFTLLAIGLGASIAVVAATGVALLGWAAVTMWRWAR